MAKGYSAGNRLVFKEEYQLISSAKSMNDKNIDDTIASLKGKKTQAAPVNNSGASLLQPAN